VEAQSTSTFKDRPFSVKSGGVRTPWYLPVIGSHTLTFFRDRLKKTTRPWRHPSSLVLVQVLIPQW
jgi:hypothetical protein